METEKQNGSHSGWRIAGRAASFVFLPRWFFSEASGVARDVGKLGRMVQSVMHTDTDETRVGPDWDTTMLMHGFSEAELRRQMTVREILAWIMLLATVINFAAAFLYAPIGWITGSLCAVWYLKHVLTMTQIRAHCFCTVWEYFAACACYPRGFLPVGLPRDWKLLDKEPGKEVAK